MVPEIKSRFQAAVVNGYFHTFNSRGFYNLYIVVMSEIFSKVNVYGNGISFAFLKNTLIAEGEGFNTVAVNICQAVLNCAISINVTPMPEPISTAPIIREMINFFIAVFSFLPNKPLQQQRTKR